MDRWKHFTKVDFSNRDIKQFHIDTRSFYCLECIYKSDISFKLLEDKPWLFLLSEQELIQLIRRYEYQSGGVGSWRFFTLKGYNNSWNLKYLRVVRYKDWFLVCTKDHFPLKKDVIYTDVDDDVVKTLIKGIA